MHYLLEPRGCDQSGRGQAGPKKKTKEARREQEKRKRKWSSEAGAEKQEEKNEREVEMNKSNDAAVSTLCYASLSTALPPCRKKRRGNNEKHRKDFFRKMGHGGRVDTKEQADFVGPPVGPPVMPRREHTGSRWL